MSNQLFCIFCGAKLPAEAKFCPSCGKSINEHLNAGVNDGQFTSESIDSIIDNTVISQDEEEKEEENKLYDSVGHTEVIEESNNDYASTNLPNSSSKKYFNITAIVLIVVFLIWLLLSLIHDTSKINNCIDSVNSTSTTENQTHKYRNSDWSFSYENSDITGPSSMTKGNESYYVSVDTEMPHNDYITKYTGGRRTAVFYFYAEAPDLRDWDMDECTFVETFTYSGKGYLEGSFTYWGSIKKTKDYISCSYNPETGKRAFCNGIRTTNTGFISDYRYVVKKEFLGPYTVSRINSNGILEKVGNWNSVDDVYYFLLNDCLPTLSEPYCKSSVSNTNSSAGIGSDNYDPLKGTMCGRLCYMYIDYYGKKGYFYYDGNTNDIHRLKIIQEARIGGAVVELTMEEYDSGNNVIGRLKGDYTTAWNFSGTYSSFGGEYEFNFSAAN